jgi:photosystem II stability/assembly factor-like uncharacterized protein
VNRRILPQRVALWAGAAVCALAGSGLLAQAPQAQPPQPQAAAQAQRVQQAPELPPPINPTADPLLKPFIWRSIGPANMGGRIDDIAVVESNPSIIYVGYATGGVWKTTNNGTTWTPIFDTYPVSSIGDIALAPSNPDIIYVGTGEPNSRQSSSFGGGVYKSTDAGKTFQYVGLKETQTIGRVVVHPKNPDIVYVAAVGHLFGRNRERGLYKTTDGGKTWTNTRFIDEDTGFTDVVMDPSKPDVLFAASYQRRRQPWGFNGGGAGSALWKTTDGGRNWTRLTGNGLPENPIIGRIGVDLARSKPGTVYASIEVGPSGGTGAGVNDDGSLQAPGQGRGGFGGGRGDPTAPPPPPDPKKSGIWRSDDGGRTWKVVSNQGDRWMYYSQIRIDPTNPEIAYQGGAPFFKSVDGGRTWRQVQGIPHSDHHAIWINPRNADHILLGNDGGLAVSYDQGDTWEYVNTMPTGQFYAISADMRKPYYVCGGLQDNGSWCGPSATRTTNGITNFDWFRIGGADGFYTANDPTDWTVIYFESQDGNINRLELRSGGRGQNIRPRGPQAGGRSTLPPGGEQIAAAMGLNQEQAIALARQFGFIGNPAGNVVPAPAPATTYRFFWNTPFILSPHNPRTVYLGGERLFRSYNRGDTWTASPDLTRNMGRNDRPIMGVAGNAPMASKHDGAASYSNITTIAESHVLPGVLWAGTNDGNVQVSRDGGASWKNVIEKIAAAPREAHISRVETSHFDAGTAYVSIDAHRIDDHSPYIFQTTDYGETWTSIAGNLPPGNVNVVRADPKNRHLLYAGTEYGFYVSLDGGKDWKRFMQGLPTVRVDDVLVHPRDNDLVLGTHGRSIYIMDDITPLQQLTDSALDADAHVFEVRPAVAWLTDTQKAILVEGAKHFRAPNPPRGTAISYRLKKPAEGAVTITISDISGREVRSLDGPKEAGLHRVQWNIARALPGGRGREGQVPPQLQQFLGRGGLTGPPVAAGPYLVKIAIGDKVIAQKTITVEADTTFMQ